MRWRGFVSLLGCLAACEVHSIPVVGPVWLDAAADVAPDVAVDGPCLPEVCDGLDNDCNGLVDDGITAEFLPCGDWGACVGAKPVCLGRQGWCCNYGPDVETLPDNPCVVVSEEEVCDGIDGDCDGETDESFDFCNDIRHCGACSGPGGYGERGQCGIPNAIAMCALDGCAGDCRGCAVCVIDICRPGFEPCDGEEPPKECNGCHCPPGPEICDGMDNDCDGLIDEDVTSPNFCSWLGACAGTEPGCMGVDGWCCRYGNDVERQPDAPCTVVDHETRCDGLDNDCDGLTDEGLDC